MNAGPHSNWPKRWLNLLHSLSDIALFSGDLSQARSLFEESLLLHHESSNPRGLAAILAGLAAVSATEGQPQMAVTLWEATEAIHASLGNPRPALRHQDYRARVEAIRDQLGAHLLNAAVAAGRSMTLNQVIGFAFNNP